MRKRIENEPLYRQYKKAGEKCAYCQDKIDFEKITIDHFKPASHGHHRINNRVFACMFCNSLKGDKNMSDFIIYCAQYIDKNKLKTNNKIRKAKQILANMQIPNIYIF